jgi:hypothetical protein
MLYSAAESGQICPSCYNLMLTMSEGGWSCSNCSMQVSNYLIERKVTDGKFNTNSEEVCETDGSTVKVPNKSRNARSRNKSR